jgi:hypothetical protein
MPLVAGQRSAAERRRYAEACTRRIERQCARRVSEMDAVYSRYLSDTLRQRLEAAADDRRRAEGAEAEVDLAADTAVAEARLYDAACAAHDAACESGDADLALKALDAVVASGRQLRSALGEVVELRERHARMLQAGRGSLPAGAVGAVVMQVVQISRDVLGDRPEVAELARRLQEEVRVVDGRVAGTHRTPDMDADEMDATVPWCPATPAIEGSAETREAS